MASELKQDFDLREKGRERTVLNSVLGLNNLEVEVCFQFLFSGNSGTNFRKGKKRKYSIFMGHPHPDVTINSKMN